MSDFLKDIKANVILSAVITIIFGVILVLYPATIPVFICKLIGAALIIMGIVGAIAFLMGEGYERLFAIGALIIIALGVWFFTHPEAVLSLVPIIVGIILIYHGIGDLGLWSDAKRLDLAHQTYYLIVAVISIVMGLICICAAFSVIKLGMMLVGIFLIYDGVSDLVVGVNVGKGNRAYSRNFNEDEPIDVDYEEHDA